MTEDDAAMIKLEWGMKTSECEGMAAGPPRARRGTRRRQHTRPSPRNTQGRGTAEAAFLPDNSMPLPLPDCDWKVETALPDPEVVRWWGTRSN